MSTPLASWNESAAKSAIIDYVTKVTMIGGRDFMRAVCEEIYGIPRAMTIGSSVTFKYSEDDQAVAQIVRTREIEQPIIAAGNSDGDIHMLKYAQGRAGISLRLLVHHDDAEREYVYDAGSEKALQLAAHDGWTIVSMKNDWKTVF